LAGERGGEVDLLLARADTPAGSDQDIAVVGGRIYTGTTFY
jgi:hypothetical protein